MSPSANPVHSPDPPPWFQHAMAAALEPLISQVTQLQTRFDKMEANVARVDRTAATLWNRSTTGGSAEVFEVVLFPDYTSPRDLNLPLLTSRSAIEALTPEEINTYYENYYVHGQAASVDSRLLKIYQAIGVRRPI